jgi:hypothetical protein
MPLPYLGAVQPVKNLLDELDTCWPDYIIRPR